MSDVRVNGVRLNYDLDGAGEPLVLIHGSWTDHRGWDRVVPGLRDSFRVLRYDRRGHSASERPAGQGSYREDVADVVALLAELDLAPAHLVGNSFGAALALFVAATCPDAVRSVVAHEPPLVGLAGEEAVQQMQADEEPVLRLLEQGQDEAAARRFVEEIALGPGEWSRLPESVRAVMTNNAPTYLDELRDPDYPSWVQEDELGLPKIRCPVLLSQGDQSPAFFAQVMQRVAALVPQAERHLYAGAGHVPHLTHPEAYVERVTAFARSARAGKGPEPSPG